jgi:hypothetical protein
MWVLVQPDGEVIDGICAMTYSQAMGINQSRAMQNKRSRWEEYDPIVHGTAAQIVAHLAEFDAAI